ncbi:MAG: DNA primase [Gemmobacter sp.]
MSLPAGFLDELRSRLTLSHVVGRKVAWDMRKSNQAKGDWWAPCPFHQERTASFHVDDRKGFYYCFGCHAKGDLISFVKETENLGFMEAVELLAREAGLQMPARDAKAAEVADRRTRLIAAVEAAVGHYRLMLRASAGAAARDYLSRRGLSPEAQERWGIGYAPDARQGLLSALEARGFSGDLLVEAGLAVRPEDGGAPYDRFRDRIIFPIRDGRGRVISLGGRAMDPRARAKYLNGPETTIFDKGRTLYNLDRAREAVGKGTPLIVTEGYMDTIALSEAGFRATVAPLGTAITEDQLHLIWRLHDEPVIALDGDAAGLRAAHRLIDLALPLIEAGRSLRFAMLPEGMDPDDLIRAEGAVGFARVLDAAQPMSALLWRRETEGRVLDSPERRAALDKALRAVLRRIADPSIRGHYGQEFDRLRRELFGSTQRSGRSFVPRGAKAPAMPTAGVRSSLLASGGAVEDRLREAVILVTCALHPQVAQEFESALERLETSGPDQAELRRAVLGAAGQPDAADRIRAEAGSAFDRLAALELVRIAPPVRQPGDPARARLCIAEELAKLDARRAVEAEIAEAMDEMSAVADEGLTWRLAQATAASHRAMRASVGESADSTGDAGAVSARLDAMIAQQVWVKRRR